MSNHPVNHFIAARLRQVRHMHHLSIETMAGLVGNRVTARAIETFERAERSIPVTHLEVIAASLQVPLGFLLPDAAPEEGLMLTDREAQLLTVFHTMGTAEQDALLSRLSSQRRVR